MPIIVTIDSADRRIVNEMVNVCGILLASRTEQKELEQLCRFSASVFA